MTGKHGARDARRRAILHKRYPGRKPGEPLDQRGWSALQADHGPLRPPGAESPADQVRRLAAERAAREAIHPVPAEAGSDDPAVILDGWPGTPPPVGLGRDVTPEDPPA